MPDQPEGPAKRQVAGRGPAGKEIAALLEAAQRQGVAVLGTITKAALKRALTAGNAMAIRFTPEERAKLADAIAATNATAELMGRMRVRIALAKHGGK